MKTLSSYKNQILSTSDDNKIIIVRLVVGLIFISEGLQKYMIMPVMGPAFFKDIGFDYPMFWAYLTGALEILCGLLVLFGCLTRVACLPLLVIMFAALVTTKIPILATRDFWTFSHEYATDFSLTLLLILLIFSGGGKWSLDLKMLRSGS